MKKQLCLLAALLLFAPFVGAGEARAASGSPVEISEIMTANRCTLRAEDGSFPDWVELYNPSSEPVSLEGLLLSDRLSKKQGAPLPALTLPAGGRLVLYADGAQSTESEPHLPFKLSEGETVFLLSAEGTVLDELSTEGAERDCSICKDGGTVRLSAYPTPGYENTLAGFAALQDASRCDAPLQISEVKVADYSAYYREEETHYDWVELVNASAGTVRLSDYWLSDAGDELRRLRLPDRELAPGEITVIRCDASGLALNAARESLYLSDAAGIVD